MLYQATVLMRARLSTAHLHRTGTWILVFVFLVFDPTAIRILPFRKTAFATRCLGFPTKHILWQASASQLLGSILNLVIVTLRLLSL